MRAKRSMFEKGVFVLVLGLTVVLGTGLYKTKTNATRGMLLMQELSMIRSGVTLYKTMNHRNPPNLTTLTQETYVLGDGLRRPYLEKLPEDAHGSIIDPFGNTYAYDMNTGWVKCLTRGYDTW